MRTIAYGLRAEYEGEVELVDPDDGSTSTVPRFSGGLIRLDEHRELNVREALDAGEGTIHVDENDAAALFVLDAYPALKRVPEQNRDDAQADAGDASETGTVGKYDGMIGADLRRELEIRGLSTTGRNAELVERLVANDEAVAAGETETNPDAPASGESE